ncbi:murein hydrolase activator EnvC [Dysgonomonas sp. ZJ709]|uniref:murein hydrolase activator EnvC family protein n=1 Tax=Dysgonomonas sp. ZJ709 TaxID=2709797 RepID=UPI0013EAD9F3|nr:M23 family metallopeptidase [Dysgonomonas sp. ZJ709]
MSTKKKNKHNLWKRLHFKYRLSAINENTLEEIWKLRASIFSGAVLFLLFAFMLVTATSVIIITTPIRYYLPGYLDSEVREQAIKSAIKIDSLEQQMMYQEAYMQNLKGIFAGTRQFDSVKILDTISISENDPLLKKTQSEIDYTNRYAEEEKYNLSVLPQGMDNPMDGIVFFKPVKGIIIQKFNPSKQIFGVNINTTTKESVSAALEGTVIFAGYDFKEGYMIQIQHKNGFISIYKHNTMLLKKVGDKVRTGEAIAVIEADKENTKTDSFLQFELWYKGTAVNPEDYISF